MRIPINSSTFVQTLILLTLAYNLAAVPVSNGRTKGCDVACQRECLEVLNKYRINHDAPKLQFSQALADKAQKWADAGKFGYDMDARGKYGQLIEWDVKDELPTFKAVIKHWHDKERDYDFVKGKSKNGQTLHDFTQVVWKKARKAGCGRGKMFGSRYYVVWMDADGTISTKFLSGEIKNVAAPKERDLHWFEITGMSAVGKPLFVPNTKSKQSENCQCNNTSQHHDCCSQLQQKIRTKSSVSEDEEDMTGKDNEEQVLNDSSNIKNYMDDSLSQVFAEENKEVENLRDELDSISANPSLRMFYSQLSNGDEMPSNQIQQSENNQQENGSSETNIRNMYTNNMDSNEDQGSTNVENIGSASQQQRSSSTSVTETGSTDAKESDNKDGRKTTNSLEKISPEAAFSKFTRPNNLARKGSGTSRQEREMAGLIMGKVSDIGSQENVPSDKISKEYNSNIINDDDLKPDMKIELSKVARILDSRIKTLARMQDTSSKARNYGPVKESDPINLKSDDEHDARPAKITLVGAPLSIPEKIKNKADGIKDEVAKKVKELWKVHLKEKKQKRKESEQFENDVYQDSGEDNEDINASDGDKNKRKNKDDSESVTVEDLNQLHGYQYMANGQSHQYNGMNPITGQSFQPNALSHGYSIDGMQSPSHTHPPIAGGWFGNPMGFSQTLGNPLSETMNMATGGLYEYRKKFTSDESEQQPVSNRIQNSEDFSGNKDTSTQITTQHDQNTRQEEHEANTDKESALEPIKAPGRSGEDDSNIKGPFISQDHHDVLSLPKELQFHDVQDQETSLSHNLPEMITENPSVSGSSEESDIQPGYFNQELSVNGPYSYQNDQLPKTVSSPSQSQSSYNYPVQAPTSAQTPMLSSGSQRLEDFQMQGSTYSQQPSQQHHLAQDAMQQQTINEASSSQQTMRQNDYRQRPPSTMQGLGEQALQVGAESQQDDRVQASGKIVLIPHNNGYVMLNDKETSTKNSKDDKYDSSDKDHRNSTSKQGNESTDNGKMDPYQPKHVPDSSASKAMTTLDGRPMNKPYESSGLYITKGPFVYQTDTTIVMGSPTQSSGKPMMNSKGVSYSMAQNVPAAKQQPSSPQTATKDTKQDNESSNESNKTPPKLPNGFDPSLLKRPSLEKLLKEAEKDNKAKNSKSEEEGGTPADSGNKENPEEHGKSSNKTEGSKSEKNPEKSEESKTQNESNAAENAPNNSSSMEEGKEEKSQSSSKSAEKQLESNKTISSSGDKRPEGSSESPVDEKTSGEDKDKGVSLEKEEASGVNKTKNEGSPSKESSPKNEKEDNENSESLKPSNEQESSKSSAREEGKDKGSELGSENEKKPSKESNESTTSSSDKKPEESSEREKGKESQTSSESPVGEKVSGEEKENGGSSEKEKASAGNKTKEESSNNKESPPKKEKEDNENPEILKPSENQENIEPSENEKSKNSSSEMGQKEGGSQGKGNSTESSEKEGKESSPSEQENSSSEPSGKEESSSSEKAPTKNSEEKEQSPSKNENALNIPESEEKENSSEKEKQESNNEKTPSQSDLVASIRVKQGRIFIEPQATNSAPQGEVPERNKENLQGNGAPDAASQSNKPPQTRPSNAQTNENTQSTDNVQESNTPESDKVKKVQRKPIVPFDNLISRINHALGLDSPQSKLKVSSIALASKKNSTFHESQLIRDGNGNKITVDVPEFTSEKGSQGNFVKLGQFLLNDGRPDNTSSGKSGYKSQENNGTSVNVHPNGSTPGDTVGYLQSGSQPDTSSIMKNTRTHSGCTDTGERCPLWQQRGYCSDDQYANFMKQHCKMTCGYCAFPSVQIQSERPNAIGSTFHNHGCKDSQSYEFSCPAWKSQGYCQKKEKEMKLFCRHTCNFCKRKTKGQPATSLKYNDGNFANAQTGDTNGKNFANAHTGKATKNPQSHAYAQGGNTFVQTQSSTTQQTAYAVAYPAPSPKQHTYSQAQTGSLEGQQSTAHASSENDKNSSPKSGHKSSAQAQIGSAQEASINKENTKSSEGKEHKAFGSEDSHDDEIALEENVMRDSPEYHSAESHTGQYVVTTGPEEDQQHDFDEPVFRFPKVNSVAFTKPERNDEPRLMENSGSLQDPSNADDSEVNDEEAKDKEDARINSLVNRFDSEDGDLIRENSLSEDGLHKKGAVETVATKGCDKACQKECLETINSYRRNHGAQSLTLNQDLATHAQDWADMKAYGHSAWAQEGLGGELIAVGSFYKTFPAAIKAWHDEEKNFDWSTGKSKGGETKHFKQLVFKDASYLGCGKTTVNGEPYYIAQMDEAADVDQDDSDKRESTGKPKTPDLGWYLNSSPYWKDLQERGKIPSKIHNRLV